MNHDFQVKGYWQGGRGGVGEVAGDHVITRISLPLALGGAARGTNPEEMLVSTAAACFLITLGIVLEKRGIAFDRLDVTSIGTMDAEKLKFTKLVHQPTIHILSSVTADQRATLGDAVKLAEKMCLISNAIRGNVEVDVTWSDANCELAS